MPVSSWSTTPGNNNAAPPNGWPEGQAPSTVNDCARQMMADLRTQFNDAEWMNWGDTPSQASTTSFKIATDVTSRYLVNRRLKFYDATTLYGTVASSSYSAPDTTVTVTMDSGSLSASLTSLAIAILSPTNTSFPEVLYNENKPINDTSGNELLKFGKTATAVNEMTITNAATGGTPTLSATGGDTNIPLRVSGKGTGRVELGQSTSTEVRLIADQPITDSSGNEFIKFSKAASAVNEITIENSATGLPVRIVVSGGDTNQGLGLQTKGVGIVTAECPTGLTCFALRPNSDTNASYTIKFTAATTPTAIRTVTFPDADVNLTPTKLATSWAQITYSAGTPSATTSLNVSSLTDSAVGDGIVNLTTAHTSANFSAFGTNNTNAGRNVFASPTGASTIRWVINGGSDDNVSVSSFGSQ